MDKPFLTYQEQISKLKSKLLIINDEQFAVNFLKQYGYYSLICGYKAPFKNKTTNNYIDNTHFEEILNLYHFDENLREVFLKYLLLTEKKIKESLSNAFCVQTISGKPISYMKNTPFIQGSISYTNIKSHEEIRVIELHQS